MCVPPMLYVCEIIDFKPADVDKYEVVHHQWAKSIQSLLTNVAKPAAIESLGWWQISVHIALCKLMFLIWLILLPVSNSYIDFLFY